jgi:hypothetical protein
MNGSNKPAIGPKPAFTSRTIPENTGPQMRPPLHAIRDSLRLIYLLSVLCCGLSTRRNYVENFG